MARTSNGMKVQKVINGGQYRRQENDQCGSCETDDQALNTEIDCDRHARIVVKSCKRTIRRHRCGENDPDSGKPHRDDEA